MTGTTIYQGQEAKVFSGLAAANDRRSAEATPGIVCAVRRALDRLDATGASRRDVLRRMVAAGRLRIAHPEATLAQLAAMSDPPMSKDTYAGLIRRLARNYGA
jgi:cell division protein WhiA